MWSEACGWFPFELGVEIGVGTGRFALPLGLTFGIDPSPRMLALARQRGLHVCQAVGEHLPFRDGQVGLVLLVTVICFVENVPTLLREVSRVLKPNGHLVVGFINRDSELGQRCEPRKDRNVFYRDATFYSVGEVAAWVTDAGFHAVQFCETLCGRPGEDPRIDWTFATAGVREDLWCSQRARVHPDWSALAFLAVSS